MATMDDFTTLEQDANLVDPLRRVAYEAGMMLGLEATRDEQAYHRRRLNRHHYWFQGYGTLAGMHVTIAPDEHNSNIVRLLVKPGIGIDGLGREVLINETYCIDIGQWLTAQKEAYLLDGYNTDTNTLWLNIYVRHKDCPVAQQPVLARKLNLGTDAVQPSRTADGILLELIPEETFTPVANYQPWACHTALEDISPVLTLAEQATLGELQKDSPAHAQLELHARLLHALDSAGVGINELNEQFELGARLLLARISIETSLSSIVIAPEKISVNNLVRPFLVTSSQLAWLARQPSAGA